MSRTKNPLEPAASIVQLLLVLFVVFTAVTVIGAVFGSGSMPGLGTDQLCAQSSAITQAAVDPGGLRPGVSARTVEVRLCTGPPTGTQRLLWALSTVPALLVNLTLLAFALRLVNGARREGLHSARTAGRARLLGWSVLLGGVLAGIVEALAHTEFLYSMFDHTRSRPDWLGHWDFPVWAVVLGCVLLSFARIIRVGSAMRDDLEGTV